MTLPTKQIKYYVRIILLLKWHHQRSAGSDACINGPDNCVNSSIVGPWNCAASQLWVFTQSKDFIITYLRHLSLLFSQGFTRLWHKTEQNGASRSEVKPEALFENDSQCYNSKQQNWIYFPDSNLKIWVTFLMFTHSLRCNNRVTWAIL